MNSKRIKFALFILVFVLYGCASGSRSESLDTSRTQNLTTNNPTDALSYEPAFKTLGSVDKEVVALTMIANDQASSAMVSSLYQARSVEGELQSSKVMKDYSAKLTGEVKKQIKAEKARKARIEAERKRRTFYPYTTTYGVDCYGCTNVNGRGGTASGVAIDANLGVRMPDGSWQPGIRYGKYYIIAADSEIPMCSVLKISNHGLSGDGISVDQPYYAIVLDRGGAIYGSHIDLYVGLESNNNIRRVQHTNTKAEIIRFGGRNADGSCAL